MASQSQSQPSPPPPPEKTEALDAPLHAVGFEIEEVTPQKVSGHLRVSQKSCQVSSFSVFVCFFIHEFFPAESQLGRN
jgi:hypothetical protein